MALLEKTKILDKIYLDYGVKYQYLLHALKHHDLENDEEIQTYVKAMGMEAKKAQEDIEKKQELCEKDMKLVTEALDKIAANGGVRPDGAGNIPVEKFIEIQIAVGDVINKIGTDKDPDFRQKRCDLMIEGKMEEYRTMVQEHLREGMNKKQGIMKAFLTKLQIPVQAWQVTAQGVTNNPVLKAKLETAT